MSACLFVFPPTPFYLLVIVLPGGGSMCTHHRDAAAPPTQAYTNQCHSKILVIYIIRFCGGVGFECFESQKSIFTVSATNVFLWVFLAGFLVARKLLSLASQLPGHAARRPFI